MLVQLKLPRVSGCEATDCFYNLDEVCHAPAINVGADHPACDTYISNGSKIRGGEQGRVGACHVGACRFNEELTCHADAIRVAHHAGHADCTTYTH